MNTSTLKLGVDPFGVFKTVDYGDVVVSPGDVIESHQTND